MKTNLLKISVLFMLVLSIGCSKSENAATPSNDKIVGTWKLTAYTSQTGTTGTPTDEMTTCSVSNTYVFTCATAGAANGTLSITQYNYVAPNCVPTTTTNSTWANTGTFYNMNYNGTGITQTTATFSNNNSTLLITTNDGPYIIKETFAKQ